MGGHSSRRRIAPPLKQPTRATSRNQAHVPPLFGLAPGGVCRAGRVAEAPVRSYRTLSLSQDRSLCDLLSVALSLGSPPPGVTRHRSSVEPGLSSPSP